MSRPEREASGSGPLLEVRDLVRDRPGGGRLLDRISLALYPGDRVALAGPSGSGKTLLLRALALLDAIDGGEIRFGGRPVAADEVPAYRRAVVYAHQRPALFGPTVEDDLRRPFGLAAHRERAFDRDRVVGLLEELGRPPDFPARRSEDLSGGETQIVALVRVLQLEPRALLLDEPTAGLDADASQRVERVLGGWLDERPDAALLWVGHDREQSERVTTRRIEIRGGASAAHQGLSAHPQRIFP